MLQKCCRVLLLRPPLAAWKCCSSKSSSTAGAQPEAPSEPTIEIAGQSYSTDKWTNVTPSLLQRIGRCLHRQPGHPLKLLTDRIIKHLRCEIPQFELHDSIGPVVTVQQNFDSLLIPENHVSRQPSDAYYVNRKQMLRGHTSAHQADLMLAGSTEFLVVGDVYRRDEIDRSHFPVFHQMEGVRLFTASQLLGNASAQQHQLFDLTAERSDSQQAGHSQLAAKQLEVSLKRYLEQLVLKLFGSSAQYRWVDAYFPFTHPSWELELLFDGEWMEMLGCGLIEQQILTNCGHANSVGWAFGLGLERWAMSLFSVPDIRLFWSQDSGFLNQFSSAGSDWSSITYKPISCYPQCPFSISFWLPQDESKAFHPNDFYDLVRSVAGDLAEQVSLIDEFKHPGTGRVSQCYKIVYRSHERTLTNAEVTQLHKRLETLAQQQLGVTVR